MATAPPPPQPHALDALEARIASIEHAAYGTRLAEFPPYAAPCSPSPTARARLLALEEKVAAYEALLSADPDGATTPPSSFSPGAECQALVGSTWLDGMCGGGVVGFDDRRLRPASRPDDNGHDSASPSSASPSSSSPSSVHAHL